MLTRWTDWGFGDMERTLAEFDALRREMNRLFEGEAPTHRGRGPRPAIAAGAPRFELRDRGEDLWLRAEVPGVSDKDLDINLDRGMLTLKGEREVDVPEGYSVLRRERGQMAFARSFTLPCEVDAEKTQATLKNGVLTLVLPKAAQAKPRQISVSTK